MSIQQDDAAAFADAMREADDTGDIESAHSDMDRLMCSKLRELGYGDAVDVFESTDRWYA